MLKYFILGFILIILAIIIRLMIKAINFKPLEENPVEAFHMELDDDAIIKRFQEMIRCKTISYLDTSLEDEEEFIKFRELLKNNYPNVHESCQLHKIGRTGLFYYWKGKSSEKPAVFMSHYDVVPANSHQWDKDPFSAVIEDGVLWGRGTLDTKATLCGIMESAEKLIGEGFVPKNDIYLSFAGDEETNGASASVIVEFLKNRDIEPFLVLDEGGAIVEGVIPGVKERAALVGTGEKGKIHLRLSLKSQGGHGSAPPPTSQIARLGKAVNKVEKNPFPFHLSQPVKDMFRTTGPYSSFGLKMVFANLSFFSPILDMITRKTGGELNALVRTTVAFTKMKGSDTINVMPPFATVEADVRVMEGDSKESVIKGIRDKIDDDEILVEILDNIPVRRFSNIDTEPWEILKTAINSIWPEVIVSPYLMMACSDSRSYTKISENVFRFSAMELSSDERKLIHGNNERIPTDKLITAVKFFSSMMTRL